MTDSMQRNDAEILGTVREMKTALAILNDIVSGNERTGLRGLRSRVEYLEKLVEVLVEERKQVKWMLRGILIGLGITGLGSLGTLIAVLRTLAELAP